MRQGASIVRQNSLAPAHKAPLWFVLLNATRIPSRITQLARQLPSDAAVLSCLWKRDESYWLPEARILEDSKKQSFFSRSSLKPQKATIERSGKFFGENWNLPGALRGEWKQISTSAKQRHQARGRVGSHGSCCRQRTQPAGDRYGRHARPGPRRHFVAPLNQQNCHPKHPV